MPVEIVKYLCQFKCGTKAKSLLRAINAHEAICFKNPERKACTTCVNEVYEYDGCDHPELSGNPKEEWMNRSCKKIPYEEFEKLWESCDYHTKPVFHIQPVVNCPHYEQKEFINKKKTLQ